MAFYEKTVLDNGITVITEYIDSVRSATIGMWFSVGSRDEESAEAGMSHFMEHMMFKGTPARTAADISEAFDSLGAELNAFTSKEYTCYFTRLVDEKVPAAVELLSDMIINSLFASDAVESEREVVVEEIARTDDMPDDLVHDVVADALFDDLGIGRPILGSRESVGSFTHEACKGFHDRRYRAGNMVVAVAGHIDHDTVVELVSTYFAAMPVGPRNERAPIALGEPKRIALLNKDTEQAHIVVGRHSLAAGDPDRYAASLMDAALGGGMSSRLFQEVREKRGLAYAVYSYLMPFGDVGQFGAYVGTRPDNALEAVSIINQEIDRFLQDGIGAGELVRVRESTVGSLILSMESTRIRMQRLGRNELLGLDHLSLDETIERFQAVTAADVARVAERILANPSSLAVIGPYEESDFASVLRGEAS